jgi:hypothetical protein
MQCFHKIISDRFQVEVPLNVQWLQHFSLFIV